MSKKYLNVVSAGVMAFGTLALGLVTVLPMASAANAAEMYVQKDIDGNVVDYSNVKDDADTADDTNTTAGMYTDPSKGCPAGFTWNEDQYTCLPGVNVEPETPKPEVKPEVKPDAPKPEVKPEKPEKKGAEASTATQESKAQKPSADKGTAAEGAAKDAPKDAPKGQQQVKKGHHKFGAPNTGYEF